MNAASARAARSAPWPGRRRALRWLILISSAASGCASRLGSATMPELEVGGQALVALGVNDETRGGGGGLAVEASLPVTELVGCLRGQLLARARAGALLGAGTAWLLEAGVAYRPLLAGRWQPDAGVSLAVLTGDLVRSIDTEGRSSSDPLALQLGLNPLRWSLAQGWVSSLGVKAGPTLFQGGAPPLALSLTLFEVGSRF